VLSCLRVEDSLAIGIHFMKGLVEPKSSSRGDLGTTSKGVPLTGSSYKDLGGDLPTSLS
jgi:hypothetical protein